MTRNNYFKDQKAKGEILVSGSLAYDRIMNFPGKFREHILPDKIHILNVSFLVKAVKISWGGTAGNIVYNLALLGEKVKLLGVVGEDFFEYEKWLKRKKVDISKIKKVKNGLTAGAYIVTDARDNQITAYFPGPAESKYPQIVKKIKNIKLAIVSPEVKARMLAYTKIYKQKKVPYIFDPGQQITAFNSLELKQAIKGSYALIGNDYEIQLILNKLKIKQAALEKMTEILIVTKGEKGAIIYSEGKETKIKSAKPKNTSDPTGAGDAFRAGLIKGLVMGLPFKQIGQLASTVAVYTVEKYGTQTHTFTKKSLSERYKKNYKEGIRL